MLGSNGSGTGIVEERWRVSDGKGIEITGERWRGNDGNGVIDGNETGSVRE